MKFALGGLGACLAAVAAFTWWALESSGVAVITTQSSQGPRSTHVWYVEDAGERLLEAGTPENPWFVDLQTNPQLELSVEGASQTYLTAALPNPKGHERIRSLLRAKYGARDAWIALLFDTRRSVAVTLSPLAD